MRSLPRLVLAAFALAALGPSRGSAQAESARTAPSAAPRTERPATERPATERPATERAAERRPLLPSHDALLEGDQGPRRDDSQEQLAAGVEAYFDRAITRDRFEARGADAWYHDVGRSMQGTFAATPDLRAGGDRGPLQEIWAALQQHSRPPSAPTRSRSPPPELRGSVRDPTDRAAAAAQEHFDWMDPRYAPVHWVGAVVRLEHDAEGNLTSARLLRSSDSPALDRAALAAARSHERFDVAPPARVVRGRGSVQSDWAFEVGEVRLPLTSFACEDDPARGLLCAAFGRGIARLRVRLLGVVDAIYPSPEERRAMRRARRR